MVRTYQRKSTYSKYNKEHVLKAVKAIKVDSKSLTKVADEYGIKVSSLYYHLNRYKDYDFSNEEDIKTLKNFNQVFTKELENKFVKEFVDATDYCLGLGPMNIRKFAYQFAIHQEVDVRQTWMENEAAGEDWLNAFLKRHPGITNISSYNAHSIQMYFKNYEILLERYGFRDSQIYKADEVAFTTVKQSNRVFARRGKKEESELQFLGQDELTTMVSTISASGSALTPMFIIPRTSFVSDMMEKALEGSIKVSNKSGWMTKSDFIEYLAHFVRVTKCSKTDPCLLMLDNHASCLTLEAIEYAKKHGVFLQLLPLHTYNKLQPLKDKVFVNLKCEVNRECKKWVTNNAKKPMKINDILKVVEKVFPKVFMSHDIKVGFESSNIYPLNSSSFNDENTNVPKGVTKSNSNNDIAHDTDPIIKDIKKEIKEETDFFGKGADSIEKDADTVEKDTVHVVKEELETADEVVVIYSPKDSNSTKKIPLAKIEQILGITLKLEKRDSDVTSTEQKENIEDHGSTNDSEQETDDSKELSEDEDITIKKVSNTSKKNKLDKSNKSETDKRKRRKPNSKLLDYICY